jgi:hypothetical protein
LRKESRGISSQTVTKKASAKKAAVHAVSTATVSPNTPNVLQELVQLEQVKIAQKTSNVVDLDTEKEKDTTEQVVQRLQQLLQAKKARTHVVTVHDDNCDKQSSDDWNLADYRREAARIQNRRSVTLGTREDVPTPQKGQGGSAGAFSPGACGMDFVLEP